MLDITKYMNEVQSEIDSNPETISELEENLIEAGKCFSDNQCFMLETQTLLSTAKIHFRKGEYLEAREKIVTCLNFS